MSKLLAILTVTALIVSSCKTVYSTTSIEPNKSFVLGENDHDAFEVSVKNISREDIKISKMPKGGTKESVQILYPDKKASIKIERNTALYLDNNSNKNVSVEIVLKSNSNLSMGYKD